MNKPITRIRELENGDIVLKYMPKGRLEAPVVETAVEVASNSFKFSWSPSENATFYTVKVYGISGDGQWTEHPVFVADSLSETCAQSGWTIPDISRMPMAFRHWTMNTKIRSFPITAMSNYLRMPYGK